MIYYCVEHWPKRKLQQKSLKWPWYGSRDKWLCNLLYQQVCNQENLNSVEVEYITCWVKFLEGDSLRNKQNRTKSRNQRKRIKKMRELLKKGGIPWTM